MFISLFEKCAEQKIENDPEMQETSIGLDFPINENDCDQ